MKRAETDTAASMAIFLGKNELEQTDKQDLRLEGGGMPVPIRIIEVQANESKQPTD